jgi:2-polyprenyl-3-methyl-5-hydroxy-6-metoxy-1,4-benzoquinol methylase
MTDLNYPFESSDHERQRLQRQADILSDITEQVFRRAGIAPGMRILDVGSGAGDVAFLARKLIGKKGSVIGTDRDMDQVAYATRRARSFGYTNVQFITSDYPELVLDGTVDAVVGRYVLGFACDPVAALAGFVVICGRAELSHSSKTISNTMLPFLSNRSMDWQPKQQHGLSQDYVTLNFSPDLV